MRGYYEIKKLERDAKNLDLEARLAKVNLHVAIIKRNAYNAYLKSSEEEKSRILSDLESLSVKIIEAMKTREQRQSVFSHEAAKLARVKAGFIRQKDLAEHLSLGFPSLCKYENGDYFGISIPTGEGCLKYLEWLKSQGYNPYNL